MKQIYKLIIVLFFMSIFSCEKCDVLEITETTGGTIPIDFDCPDLALNFGSPCDDDNVETINDVVNENCECEGEIPGCTGTFYAKKYGVNDDGVLVRTMVSFPKPKPNDFISTELEDVSSIISIDGEITSNFSTYDDINDIYVFAYNNADATVVNPLFVANTNPYSSSYSTETFKYAAPVMTDGKLYAIDAQQDGAMATYSILEVNVTTGVTSTLFTETITVISPLINSLFSSASDENGTIYFLCATNLITFNIGTANATHLDLDPNYNPNFPELFFGLEYQSNQGQLLALLQGVNGANHPVELVSISTDGNGNINSVFDVFSSLGNQNDGEIMFEYYSTTYSSCDNMYYISELVEIGVSEENLQTFIIDIDLNNNILTEIIKPGYYYGIELKEGG